jgi:peptide-methionine (S)-S-oxide reductase
LYHTPEQEGVAKEVIERLGASGIWENRIVTTVEKYQGFYPGEEHHQGYYRRNQERPYCQAVITPKLAKLRREHLEKLKRV